MKMATIRVVVPTSVLFRELDGEAVVLNLESGRYHLLDPAGTRFWTALLAAGSVSGAVMHLQKEFEASPVVLRHDLEDFVRELEKRGLLSSMPA